MNGTVFDPGSKTIIVKNVIFILFLTMGVQSVSAECAMSGMQFFPQQKEISLNSMFIIQGYSFSRKTINSFKERTIYLKSEEGELIELDLLEILKGQMMITQAIFRPVSELRPNTTYFLKYADQTENEEREMMQYNSEKKKSEKVSWRTTDKKTIGALNPRLELVFEKTEVIYYGCGPSVNAIFDVKNKLQGEIWYKTEVLEIGTNKKTVYYIKEWNGKLKVGHGMCSGAFTFNQKGSYKVRFTPMNTDGKQGDTTGWIAFDSPYKNDKGPFGSQ